MKILVTGATGFLGSHIVKALLKNSHEIIILKRSFSDICRIKDEINKVKHYDIDKEDLNAVFYDNKDIDIIIHTAVNYGRKKQTFPDVYESNVMFPFRLLDIACRNKVNQFINASSFSQSIMDINYPIYPYLKSKRDFLSLGEIYSKNKKIKFIDFELQHLYGAFDSETKFIPFIINSCINNIFVLKLTKGEQEKDFIYIDDVIEAYMEIINCCCKDYYKKYYIGTGKSISIKQAVETIKKLTASKTKLNFGALPYNKGEMMRVNADISLNSTLNWKAKTEFNAGILKVIDWIKSK
ncbi:MAG: NAD(P)-dependent oxidoreductase [Elusimicrobiota bacterium]|jgi:nucleoside-diphosphate-sugar epimerase|nr:NAD(P)-dependent oxidoreductase [Elusimicrobiota bacterium]